MTSSEFDSGFGLRVLLLLLLTGLAGWHWCPCSLGLLQIIPLPAVQLGLAVMIELEEGRFGLSRCDNNSVAVVAGQGGASSGGC